MGNGIKLVTNGTDNHMILVDLTPFGKGKGIFIQEALEMANMTVNKNTIPAEPSSPFYPSGIRLGTPAITTRGMKENEMKIIGKWIADVVKEVKEFTLPDGKEERAAYLKNFKESIRKNKKIAQIRNEVIELCNDFPLYPGLEVLK